MLNDETDQCEVHCRVSIASIRPLSFTSVVSNSSHITTCSPVVEGLLKTFTYVKALIRQCNNTPLPVKVMRSKYI